MRFRPNTVRASGRTPSDQVVVRPLSLALDAVQDAAERAVRELTGERIKLVLTPSDVREPSELPNYLAGYRPMTFRAHDCSPVVSVVKDTDKFRNFSSDDAFQRVDVKTSLMGTVPEVDPRSSLTTYKVVERASGSFIPQQTEMNEGPGLLRARIAAAKRCRWALELDIEHDVLGATGLLTTNTNYAAAVRIALGATENWGGATVGVDSDPIRDLLKMQENTAQPISFFAMNVKLVNAFVRHSLVRDHFRMYMGDSQLSGTISELGKVNDAGVTLDFMIPAVGMVKVVASKSKNETTGAKDYIFPNGTVIGVTVPRSEMPTSGEEIATSYTFRRTQPSGQLYEAREFRVEGRGPLGGTMVVIAEASDHKMVGTDCGGIITGAYT